MKVILAETLGFCPGVRIAIQKAEDALAQCKSGESVTSLGPLIHNADEVQRLKQTGLNVAESSESIEGGKVVIRSHGVAPDVIERLKQQGLEVLDATCGLVKRLHQAARELADEGRQVIIIGQQEHPEVQAVLGHVPEAWVVATPEGLERIPPQTRLGVVAQTTESPTHVDAMLAALRQGDFGDLRVINTLCKESCKRQQAAVALAGQVDIMFVLGGLNSANTRQLARLCRERNEQTYHLEGVKDLDLALLEGKTIAGVTAGASTPDWIIEAFVQRLLNL